MAIYWVLFVSYTTIYFGFEASKMILNNQEMSRIFDLLIVLPNDSKIYIVPVIFTILFLLSDNKENKL